MDSARASHIEEGPVDVLLGHNPSISVNRISNPTGAHESNTYTKLFSQLKQEGKDLDAREEALVKREKVVKEREDELDAADGAEVDDFPKAFESSYQTLAAFKSGSDRKFVSGVDPMYLMFKAAEDREKLNGTGKLDAVCDRDILQKAEAAVNDCDLFSRKPLSIDVTRANEGNMPAPSPIAASKLKGNSFADEFEVDSQTTFAGLAVNDSLEYDEFQTDEVANLEGKERDMRTAQKAQDIEQEMWAKAQKEADEFSWVNKAAAANTIGKEPQPALLTAEESNLFRDFFNDPHIPSPTTTAAAAAREPALTFAPRAMHYGPGFDRTAWGISLGPEPSGELSGTWPLVFGKDPTFTTHSNAVPSIDSKAPNLMGVPLMGPAGNIGAKTYPTTTSPLPASLDSKFEGLSNGNAATGSSWARKAATANRVGSSVTMDPPAINPTAIDVRRTNSEYEAWEKVLPPRNFPVLYNLAPKPASPTPPELSAEEVTADLAAMGLGNRKSAEGGKEIMEAIYEDPEEGEVDEDGNDVVEH